jgi:diketogulonate reductase-like aldo/keto reductase
MEKTNDRRDRIQPHHVQAQQCPARIAENIGIFDFALSGAEIAWIGALDTGVRAGPDPTQIDTNSLSEYS